MKHKSKIVIKILAKNSNNNYNQQFELCKSYQQIQNQTFSNEIQKKMYDLNLQEDRHIFIYIFSKSALCLYRKTNQNSILQLSKMIQSLTITEPAILSHKRKCVKMNRNFSNH